MKSFKSDALRHVLVNEMGIDIDHDTYSSFFTERQFKYYSDPSRCGMGMREARERLSQIAEYRDAYSASAQGCDLCTDTEKVHSIRCLGKGKEDAILFMVPGQATDTSTYDVCKHMLREVDTCFDTSDKLVWMMSFQDYSYDHIVSNTTLTYHFAKWLNHCFYERVSTIVLLSPPSYFYPVIYLGKSLVSQELADKVVIVDNPNTIQDDLRKYLTEDQMETIKEYI